MILTFLLIGALLVTGAFALRARVFRWWNIPCLLMWAIGWGLVGGALDFFFFDGFPVAVPTLTVVAALSGHPLFFRTRNYV